MSLSTIPAALDALRAGRPVLVADDEARENEGDIVLAAEAATQEWIAWTVQHSSGFICAPMTDELADRLQLPVMVPDNEDPRGTNYTISVDAADRLSTGISAADRAHTLRVLGAADASAADVIRPGHIMPLRAAPGGVRERAGHTEAAVDLLRLAGMRPVGAIAEVVTEDGSGMMRLPGLIELGRRDDVPVITIADLIRHLDGIDAGARADSPSPSSPTEADRRENTVRFEAETEIATEHGRFLFRAYRDLVTGFDHLAVVSTTRPLADGALVRVHSECLTGEAFGSRRCECGPQLDAALDRIDAEGGAVIYLRGQEGRGIGLINKLRAYRLQDTGLDTLDANLALGLAGDARDYGGASAILADLGLSRIRLLSNNPDKRRQLQEHGVTVDELVPLVVGVTPANEHYLETKRDRMGHTLPDDAELTRMGHGR